MAIITQKFTNKTHFGLKVIKLCFIVNGKLNGGVAYGISMIFATQVFINFGVNTGLLPTKGLTLPFLSYGGNSLLICSVMIGVLLRIEYELNNPTPPREDAA